MGEGDRRALPPQPVVLEAEASHDVGRRRQRVERAELVVDEAGLDELARLDGAAGPLVRLAHHDRPALVGKEVGGDQSVGS